MHSFTDSNCIGLGCWLATNGAQFISQGQIDETFWGEELVIAALAMSMSVNALTTGLIVFRIVRVFQEVKYTSEDRMLGSSHGSKLRSVLFVIIESGMALFAIQVVRLGLSIADRALPVLEGLQFIICIHQQLNVTI